MDLPGQFFLAKRYCLINPQPDQNPILGLTLLFNTFLWSAVKLLGLGKVCATRRPTQSPSNPFFFKVSLLSRKHIFVSVGQAMLIGKWSVSTLISFLLCFNVAKGQEGTVLAKDDFGMATGMPGSQQW